MKITSGKVKAWSIRLRDYVGWAQFFMVFYLFIIQLQIHPLISLFAFVVLACVVLYIDVKFVLPSESKYFTQKNPIFDEMKDDVKEIKKMLQKRKR